MPLIGASRNLYKWPPLHVAYIAVFYHYNIALGLARNSKDVSTLLVLGGLDIPLELFGLTFTIMLLCFVSSLALIGLTFEWRFNSWWYPTLLVIPQYMLVVAGAGHGMWIIYNQHYMGRDYSFWLVETAISLFEFVALFHTLAIIMRIRFWKLALSSRQ